MKQKRYWLWFGIMLVTINILLSSVAYNDDNIRHPQGYDLKGFMYPNILLGLPTIILSQPINAFIYKLYIPKGTMPSSNGSIKVINDNPSAEYIYGITLFVQLFIVLTIYWFTIGALIGLLYNGIKNRNKLNL